MSFHINLDGSRNPDTVREQSIARKRAHMMNRGLRVVGTFRTSSIFVVRKWNRTLDFTQRRLHDFDVRTVVQVNISLKDFEGTRMRLDRKNLALRTDELRAKN